MSSSLLNHAEVVEDIESFRSGIYCERVQYCSFQLWFSVHFSGYLIAGGIQDPVAQSQLGYEYNHLK